MIRLTSVWTMHKQGKKERSKQQMSTTEMLFAGLVAIQHGRCLRFNLLHRDAISPVASSLADRPRLAVVSPKTQAAENKSPRTRKVFFLSPVAPICLTLDT